MSKHKCPNCNEYDTYNIKTRYAQVSVVLFVLAGLVFWFGTILVHPIAELIIAGVIFLAGAGFLIASLRMKNVHYCRNCEKRFSPDIVDSSNIDDFQ
ncbi:MAG: hypothetical protein K9N46_03620 [Candidatus Marinimicrobia bacterium]|nr:hypothetical protein [Candidatus Neomarinimicrobiota bacterium]MCF7829651.1 hypothetical protein [Candidatus Neomarinimicrobiota bacterium]MCF7879811.1 hypothetical protein [Candidatus Neomarinimicrobiota bacterium]